MNPKKIKEFNSLVDSKRYGSAVAMIPHIMDYKQFMDFCSKAGQHCIDIGNDIDAHRLELALLQAAQTRQKEQDLIEAESLAKQAEEEAGLAKTIFEDAQSSYEIMCEKIAHIYDKEIIDYAIEILDESGNSL